MKSIFMIAICASLALPAVVSADTNTFASTTQPHPIMRELMKEVQGERREALESAHAEYRENLKDAIEARHKELKAKLDTKLAEKRAKKLDDKAKDRVEKTVANIYERLSNTIYKLTKVDIRIKTRITELENKGVDTNSVKVLLTTAETALTKAQTDVEATKALIASEVAGATSKESLRALVTTAVDSIKSAGKSYEAVHKALKELSNLE